MKKAKEYAEEIIAVINNSTSDIILDVIRKAIIGIGCDETKELIEKRHISEEDGFVSILREQNNKYKTVARLVNEKATGEYGMRPEGCVDYWFRCVPELKQYAEKI